MWNYQLCSNDKSLLNKFSKYSIIAGAIFIILGLLAMTYPFYAALTTAAFISWFMIFTGFVAAYFTFVSDKRDWLGWLKAFILTGIGVMILVYPASGIQTVGLLLSIYLFMDGFSNFALAGLRKPQHGWLLWIFNGIVSIALAVIFLVNMPFLPKEMWLIGVYVGISIFVDGVVLTLLGLKSKKEL